MHMDGPRLWRIHACLGLDWIPDIRTYLHAGSPLFRRAQTRISFHMLHRPDHVRVKQQLICPEEEKVVARDEIVKGYEYRKGEYVVIEPAEIKKIEPKTAKAMEILEFVKADEVDPIYFESSYYLVPEEPGKRPYALLAQALEETKYVAIAKLTMHNREYTVFLRPHEGGLMLHTMYYEDEVRKVEEFGKPDVKVRRIGGEGRAPAHPSALREVRSGQISRYLRGEPEGVDQGAPGRAQSRGRSQAEGGPSYRSDERSEAKSGADEEAATASGASAGSL